MIILKTAAEIEQMRKAGALVRQVLERLGRYVAPGVRTAELDAIAEEMILAAGGTPSFKGYCGYPASICVSVNDEIIHGMPSDKRVLKKGDVVSIDIGAEIGGYYGDSATTVPVGEVSPEVAKLLRVTEESLELAIQQMRPGNRLADVSAAVQRHVERNGFSVVRDFVGHGIGTRLHEEPQVPNYVDRRNDNPRLKEGVVLAIEPMVNAGKADAKVLADRWTVVTRDGSYSAHFEHTVAVTATGPWVLTRP